MDPHTPPMTPDRLLVSLNPDQRAAVTSTADSLVVIAGAGTGKTRVLAARIVRLVRLEGVEPEAVLAFTFTRAAASELRGRIQDALGLEAERVEITTIHAWAMSLLRLAGGPEASLQVAEEAEVEEELGRLYEGATRRPEAAQCGIRKLREAIGHMETHGWNPELESAGTSSRDVAARQLLRVLLARLRQSYLIPYAAILPALATHIGGCVPLDHEGPCAACERLAAYRHVLVDEAQDLSELEQRIIRFLGEEARRLYVLDPRQSVYGWRGAQPLKPSDATAVQPLRQGYRYGAELAARAAAVGRECYGGGWEWLEDHTVTLTPAPHETPVAEIKLSTEQLEDVEDLSPLDPLEILLRHVPPARYGGGAVLTRTNRVADLIVDREPNRFHRVRNVVEDPLRAAMAMARLSLNHANPSACAHLLRVQGMTDTQIEIHRGRAGRRRSLLAQMRTMDVAEIPSLMAFLPEEGAARRLPFASVFAAVCTVRPDWADQRDGILERLDRTGISEAPLPHALDRLADELRLDGAGWDYAARHELVGVGTVHGAKGREWDHVAVVTHAGSWPAPGTDPEEWRTLYVALTRARRSVRILELPESWRPW